MIEARRVKVLFVSGSIGLGHVTRDLAIANELRKLRFDVDINWLGGEPAVTFLRDHGEYVVPESAGFSSEIDIAESLIDGYKLNLAKYLMKASKDWKESYKKFLTVVNKDSYDLVVGDEAFEIAIGYQANPTNKKQAFINMTDFEKCCQISNNPMERFVIWSVNRGWDSGYKKFKKGQGVVDSIIFIGELEDVPDEKLGTLLLNAREVASSFQFVGYAFPFDPKDYLDHQAQKHNLGYGNEKIIICSIGGTKVGKELLELCIKTYPLLKEKIPEIKMILVTGPRLKPEEIDVPEGIEIKGFVPELYKYFAACDLAIVQAGGTTTIELTALKRPFIYLPLEQHFEQLGTVVPRLHRHHAGVEMRYYETTPERLAEGIFNNFDKVIDYADIPVDGARKSAQIIANYLPIPN